MFSIVKAYENLEHIHLARQAQIHSCNSPIIRVRLVLCRMYRTVVVQAAATTTVRATRTVAPGDPFAHVLMRLVILSAMASITARYSQLHVAVLANDIQLLAVSPSSHADTVTAGTATYVRRKLEHECELLASHQKL